ncbi:hypothetical protein C8035_v001681 [Colletotrichum spinosum]|uniref:Uncharacterized protein n=2 Tax=Colletotrichum orbiculare species complex TaxID=2707354 RepID=A0A4V3HWE0_COLTR|nr:hypothetical protein C8035_v001681 [Colletotrichum spinosum]TDZ60687.1 hypothetical protein CTRI78_v004742 [Colletotrichum trifolii]
MPCPGDSTKTCGGPNAVEIFVSTDLISLEPCGHKPPVNSPSSSLPVISSTSIPDISSTSFPAPPSSTAVSSQAPPPPSSTAVSSQAPPPPSSTAVSSQAPPPPSSTTVSSQAPPSTTRGPSTTPQPPVTSKPPTTSPTSTRPALCSTTIITPATCEYGCGNWCNKNLPDFDDKESCQSARNRCKLQINACFKGAGFPGNANCHEFKAWCNDVESYCSNSCSSKKGSCSKKDCYQKKVPKGYKPGTTSVSTFACPSTPTSTSTPVTVVPPPPTGICKQPTSSSWLLKYGPGNPVGGIEIPIVTCNDVLEDFKSGNQFKLYTESDSRRCKGYGKNQVPNACAEACLEQYTECQNVYAQGCKAYNNRRRGGGYSSAPDIAKRFFFGDTWSVAINKCKIQYSDCLYENKNVLIQNKCGAFGTNY